MTPAHGAPVDTLIFDMDGTMIASLPWHRQSWLEFARRHALNTDVDDLMRRINGRTGPECIAELFQRAIEPAQADAYIQEKETIYRELFMPRFAEIGGFTQFAGQARARGMKIGVGTASDRHNIAFAYAQLQLDWTPPVSVGGDEGLPGKPEPAIFLEVARRLGADPARCLVFEDAPFGIEAARRAGMRAVAIGSSHSAAELAGPHVVAYAADYHELSAAKFLESYHAASN